MITGGSVSFTITLKVHVPVLEDPSVAVHVTTVVPVVNVEPLAGEQTTVGVPQLSEPVGVIYVMTAVHNPGSTGDVIADGQFTVGASPSFTITLNVQVPVFSAASVAVHVTSVVPVVKVDPLAGEQTTVGVPQLSEPAGVV